MNDYTRYSLIFKTNTWTHVPVRDEWQDPRHIFGGRCYLRREIQTWLEITPGSAFAILDDEDYYVNHVIAFSRPRDATMFMLRWS